MTITININFDRTGRVVLPKAVRASKPPRGFGHRSFYQSEPGKPWQRCNRRLYKMKAVLDTSVLVSAVVDQLPRHRQASDCFVRYTKGKNSRAARTRLTPLPLPGCITPDEVRTLIETNFLSRLAVSNLTQKDYVQAIKRVADLRLSSGIIYDALHLASAEKTGYAKLNPSGKKLPALEKDCKPGQSAKF